MLQKKKAQSCACGGVDFELCCGRFIVQGADALDAETLMRSRYSAYALADENYLRKTWHVSTCPTESIVSDEGHVKWLSLVVHKHVQGEDDLSAQVEFTARYKVQGRAHKLHEISDFVRENGRWFYVSGIFPEDE